MKKKTKKKFSILKLLCFLLVIVIAGIIVKVRFFSVDNIVVEGRENWDVFSAGDTAMSGDFSGKIYENNYTIDTLPDDYISSLVVDYYLAVTSDFYVEENQKEDFSYQKILSKEELNKFVDKMFGPDNKVKIVPVSYGCGRFLKNIDNLYVIGSNDPDACGLFNYQNANRYISFINNYEKKDDKILINLKVAFINVSMKETEDGEDIYYSAYSDKSKTQLITSNYDPNCLYGDNQDKQCYSGFSDYQVILKKESDNNFYFYSISKQ